MKTSNQWLDKLDRAAAKQLRKGELSVANMASEMCLSERQFRRKVKEYAGQTPNEYLRDIALEKAREIRERVGDIKTKELSKKVGYKSAGYFTRRYEEKFGTHPVKGAFSTKDL